jgi:hypothetical protein
MSSRQVRIYAKDELERYLGFPSTDKILHHGLEAPLQAFQEDYGRPDSPFIFPSGVCGGDGEIACSLLCATSDSMLATWQATMTCLILSALWQASRTFEDEASRRTIDQIQEEISAVTSFNASTFEGATVFENLYQCATESCRNDGAHCDYSFEDAEALRSSDFSEDKVFIDAGFCAGTDEKVNLDIGGPGVSTQQNCAMFSGMQG